MKILIDARLYGSENTGLGRYTMDLIEGLQEDLKNQYVVLLRKKYFNRLKLGPNWKKVLADFRHYSLAEQIKLPSIISQENPDLVHFLHFNIPIFYSGKFVVTIHDVLMHKQRGRMATTLPLPIYFLKYLGYRLIFKKAVINAEKIIVPSKCVKEEILSYYKISQDKVKIIYEGVNGEITTSDDDKILKKYKLKLPFFLYVGNAYPHKNLNRAIEAVVEVNRKQKEKVMLVIVSSRDVFSQRLLKPIASLNAGEYVKLLGFVPDSDLGSLYKRSVGFLYSSLSEGFGLPGLEAMLAGTLVLVSDIPIFKEIYKNHALYFNPYDFSNIARVTKEVLELSSEKRRKMIKKAQRYVRRFSWQKTAKQTLQVYESIL